MSRELKLGYEVGTGAAVRIPLKHTAVIGETQASGKTTTLEAVITRGAAEYGLRAIAFVTKRGEKSFRLKRDVPLFFREPEPSAATPLWQWVATIVEGAGSSVGKEEEAARKPGAACQIAFAAPPWKQNGAPVAPGKGRTGDWEKGVLR